MTSTERLRDPSIKRYRNWILVIISQLHARMNYKLELVDIFLEINKYFGIVGDENQLHLCMIQSI